MLSRLKAWIELREIVAAISFWEKDSVRQFEQAFAKLSKQEYAIAFPYGRTGLFCLLKAMGQEGKEVICPAYTCVVVPHAIVTAGAEPVFVDSKTDDFNMDWNLVEQAVTENTGAIIATSIFGQPVDISRIKLFKEKYPDIYIIQDCAHSFFAGLEGCEVNQLGDAAFYGLNISKIMTSIFGGMVTVNNETLYERIENTRSKCLSSSSVMKSISRFIYLISVSIAFNRAFYRWINKLENTGVLNRFVKYFDESVIDMPSDYKVHLTPLEARVGRVQCNKYKSIVEHRREISSIYTRRLFPVKGFELPADTPGHTYSHYVIKTKDSKNIIKYLSNHGYQLGELIDYYIPDMKSYKKNKIYGAGVARKWPGNVLNLPVHKGCTIKDANVICDKILKITHSNY